MQKRGQITTFIILGIIVLAIVALFIYLTGETARSTLPSQPAVPSDIAPVQTFVAECLQKTSQEGIIANSLQGGYYDEFDQQILSMPKSIFVPVYFNGFSIIIPSEDKLKTELEKYMQENLKNCIMNFSALEGFSIEELENVTIKQMILSENKITLSYDYPLKINNEKEIRNFVSESNLRLGKVYSMVQELVQESKIVPNLICLSCYANAGVENDVTFEQMEWGEYYVITVKDATTNPNLNFIYAVKRVNPLPS